MYFLKQISFETDSSLLLCALYKSRVDLWMMQVNIYPLGEYSMFWTSYNFFFLTDKLHGKEFHEFFALT